MGIICIVLILVVPLIIESQGQGLEATAGDKYALLSSKSRSHPFQTDDLRMSELGVKEILELLEQRQKEKQKNSRMLFEEYTEQDIEDLCATYSSIECGEQVLKVLGVGGQASIQKRCRVRREFVDCIDNERKTCKELSANKLYPVLPSKKMIKDTQEKVWRSLWTSGGCTLAI